MATTGLQQSLMNMAIGGFEAPVHVLRFKASEKIGELFCFTVEVVVEEDEFVFDDIIRQQVLLSYQSADGTIDRQVHGMVGKLEQLSSAARFSLYRIDVIPSHSLLCKRRDYRIFQDKSIEDIINDVIQSAGLPADSVEFQLNLTHDVRDYCVQFNETDFQFIDRLMREEGAYFFFKHSEDKHILVISDQDSAHEPLAHCADLFLQQDTGLVAEQTALNSFALVRNIVADTTMIRDYNFNKPALLLSESDEASDKAGLEQYHYPGRFKEPSQGQLLAKLRLESEQMQKVMIHARSNVPQLVPGQTFRLRDHRREEFNGEYLIIALEQHGEQPQVLEEYGQGDSFYTNQMICIPLGVPYRAAIPDKPLIHGIQTAFVVGPEGEEIYTDEFARVKVQFHWDRQGEMNENASCWMRVAQSWAGAGWGSLFLPRVGSEVVVSFINGDPDRPLITGQLYHATNRPPYPLPEEKTRSTIKTNSVGGDAGFNELRFDDKAGQEQIFLHAQKDRETRVLNDDVHWVGNDKHLKITNNSITEVVKDKHSKVGGDDIREVSGTVSLKIGADLQIENSADMAQKSGGDIHLSAGSKVVIEAGSELTLKVGGNFVKIDASGVTVVGSQIKLNSGGSAGSGKGAAVDVPLVVRESVQAEAAKPSKPPKPEVYSPAALVLKDAAAKGTPFCEKCAQSTG